MIRVSPLRPFARLRVGRARIVSDSASTQPDAPRIAGGGSIELALAVDCSDD
jgi:hypothetical protein